MIPQCAPLFHPAVAAWFEARFVGATTAQGEAWPAIQAGRHALIAAPTGSGKTLAAFLAAIDGLLRQGAAGCRDETQVVYVSPLKALSNDIERNLAGPLAGIREELAARGLPDVEITDLGAHRRHPAGRADEDAPPAAPYPRDHAGIPLHPSGLGVRPQDAGDDPHASSSTRSTPWRRTSAAPIWPSPSSGSSALCGGRAAAHRPLGHPEAHRGGRPLPGRRRAAGGPPTAPSSIPAIAAGRDLALGDAVLALGSGDVGRGLGAALSAGSPS